MRLWKAEYKIKCSTSGNCKTVEYIVAAKTAGDVPDIIRRECNFENATIEYIDIQLIRAESILSMKEI